MIIFFLILSILLNIAFVFCVFNILRKYEKMEDYFEELQVGLQQALKQMKTVDINGSFEADDEVGDVFKIMYGMVESLTDFLSQE